MENSRLPETENSPNARWAVPAPLIFQNLETYGVEDLAE